MKRGKSYEWIPVYVDKWLMGSTRFELEPGERSVFFDLMVMSAKDDGYIRANAEMGYPHEYLARVLNVTVELLEATITKCIKVGKINEPSPGIYYISNWEEYRLSPSYKRAVTLGIKPVPGSKETITVPGEAETVPAFLYMYKYKSKSEAESATRLQWNAFAKQWNLPPIREIPSTSKRAKALHARLEEGMDFGELLNMVGRSPFLVGRKTDFRATFDWLLAPSNYLKVMEGNYLDQRKPQVGANAKPEPMTLEKMARLRPTIEKELRNSAAFQRLTEFHREPWLAKALAEWEADQRKKIR